MSTGKREYDERRQCRDLFCSFNDFIRSIQKVSENCFQKFFLAGMFILLVLSEWLVICCRTALACPFLRKISIDSNQGHPNPSTIATTLSTNMCAKTSSYFANPTKEGICSVYEELQMNFQYILSTSGFPASDLYGAAVRLSFHDAGEVDMTNSTDKLGPDGCLANDGSSAGLTEENSVVVKVIEQIYQRVCDRISRADFWALFGNIVIEHAASSPINITYQYGRSDNMECEGGGGRLPRAEGGLAEISRVFVTQMGLTMDDAVTLLGAHSLGHTHINNSGYGFRDDRFVPDILNAWDDTPAVLDNDYYIQLTTKQWKAHLTEDTYKMQWRHAKDPLLMINADMALTYPLAIALPPLKGRNQVCSPAVNNRTYGCWNPESVTPPSTVALCLQYAADNAAFLQAFAVAYTKMTTVGYGVPANVDGATATGKLGTLTAVDFSTCGLQVQV